MKHLVLLIAIFLTMLGTCMTSFAVSEENPHICNLGEWIFAYSTMCNGTLNATPKVVFIPFSPLRLVTASASFSYSSVGKIYYNRSCICGASETSYTYHPGAIKSWSSGQYGGDSLSASFVSGNSPAIHNINFSVSCEICGSLAAKSVHRILYLVEHQAVSNNLSKARTKLGVGEECQITFRPSGISVTYNATNGSITNSGFYTAPDIGGRANVSVSATYAGETKNLGNVKTFTITAPTGVQLEKVVNSDYHENGKPSAGFDANVWLQPADVDFYNVIAIEGVCKAVATGFYAGENGREHPGGLFGKANKKYVVGKGSLLAHEDRVKIRTAAHTIYTPGTFRWDIPWGYTIDSIKFYPITKLTHYVEIDDNGTVTISKDGISVTKGLNDASCGSFY